jgi:hypothetical protein
MRTREKFPVGHPSQIAPSQACLTWRFFRDRLPKKQMHLVGMDTLLILLNLGPGYHHPRGQDITFDLDECRIWSLLKLLFLETNANSKVNLVQTHLFKPSTDVIRSVYESDHSIFNLCPNVLSKYILSNGILKVSASI